MPTAPSALVPEKVAGNKRCLLPAGFFGFQTTLVLRSARLLSVCWVTPPPPLRRLRRRTGSGQREQIGGEREEVGVTLSSKRSGGGRLSSAIVPRCSAVC